jgi:glutamyl-tRNA synthetase
LVTLDDCLPFAGWFFKSNVEPKLEDLVGKGLTRTQSVEVARRSYEILNGLNELVPSIAEPPMRALVGNLGLSPNQVFGILRAAVTGQTVSPPLFESMEIVGKQVVLDRIRVAISILEK